MGRVQNRVFEKILTYCNVIEIALAMFSKSLDRFLFPVLFLLSGGSRSNCCLDLECKCTQGRPGLFLVDAFRNSPKFGTGRRAAAREMWLHLCL